MPHIIVIPQLGESVVEGTVAKWLKAEGDAIKLDEPIVEIATDKISIEIPAPASGTLAKILVAEGVTLPVGTEIGVIAAPGESLAAVPAPAAAGSAGGAGAPAPVIGAASAPLTSPLAAQPAAPSPRADRQPAFASGAATATVEPPSVDGGEHEPSRTSPAVRRLAREHSVDLARVAGTGAGGRITKDDVVAYVGRGGAAVAPAASFAPAALQAPMAEAARPAALPVAAPAALPAPSYAPAAAAAPAPPPAAGALEEVVPMTTVRRAIAEQMARSAYTATHVTTFDEVEMTAVEALRKRWRETLAGKGVKLTYTPFFVKAAAMALREWPLLNASVVGDSVVYKKYYHVGVAVGADRGLIVPVIRDCDRKTVVEIARDIQDVGGRALEGRVKLDEIRGSTFTVTNAGGFGAKSSTPIINYPEVAILGVHAVEKRPVVRDDEVVIRLMSTLGVSFDHRIIDGHIAVQFLRRICVFLETPDLMVLGA